MLISVIGTESPASHVSPGTTFTYEWDVPEDVGPTEQDPDCLTWLYYSAVDAVRDTSSGLVGPLLVCRKGALLSSGKQVSQRRQTETFPSSQLNLLSPPRLHHLLSTAQFHPCPKGNKQHEESGVGFQSDSR